MPGVSQQRKPLLFLSHAGRDSEQARALAARLRDGGLDVWLDVERLRPGDDWMTEIQSAVEHADAFAVYVGASGVQRYVDLEVRAAIDRNVADPSFRLVPILGPGAGAQALPVFLRQKQWVELPDGEAAPEKLRNLIASILDAPAERVSFLEPDERPFRGLGVFDVQHAHLFFGRESEVADLLVRLRTSRFLALVGGSGTGKSSLLRAGLIPALERGRFHDGRDWIRDWRIAVLRPSADPFGALATAVAELAPEADAAQRMVLRRECLAQLNEGLNALLEKREPSSDTDALANGIEPNLPRGTRVLLIVDQFEELYTHASSDADPARRARAAAVRKRFIDLLLAAADRRSERPVYVVLTLRADFYAHVYEHPELAKRLAAHQMPALPAREEALRDMIERPLRLGGVTPGQGLIEDLLRDVGEEPGRLPLLEHALDELWNLRQTALTVDHYNQIGRLTGAIREHAERVVKGLGEGYVPLVRRVFGELTQLGEGSPDTRRGVSKSRLLSLGQDSAASKEIVETLINERLLTTAPNDEPVNGQGGDGQVEVAHEALIREWPRLRTWLNEDREALRFGRRLEQDAQEWLENDRDAERLYRGLRLEQAEAWGKDPATVATRAQTEFLTESVQLREKERDARRVEEEERLDRERRLAEERIQRSTAESRARVFRRLGVVAALLALTTAVFAFLFRNESRKASARESETRSWEVGYRALDAVERNPVQALVLGLEAAKENPTPVAWRALIEALHASKARLIIRNPSESRISIFASFSPDGRRLLVMNGAARVLDAETGAEVAFLSEDPRHAEFSPDGARVVTGNWDGTSRIFDAETGAELALLRGNERSVLHAKFSPDGTRVVTTSSDGTARVFEAWTGVELALLRGHEDSMDYAEFSLDGSRIVTVGSDKTARVFDVETGAELVLLRGSVEYAEFSPDGTQVVTAGSDGTARVFDTETGAELVIMSGHTSALEHAQFCPYGGLVLTAGWDGTARVFDLASGKQFFLLSHEEAVLHAEFSLDCMRVVTAGFDGTARVFDTFEGEEIASLRGHVGSVEHAEFSADGSLVVTAGEDGTVRVFDPGASAELALLRGHERSVWYAKFSPGGERVVTVGKDGTARVFDAEQGTELALLRHDDEVLHAEFSSDGAEVITAGSDGARVFDADTGAERAFTRGHGDSDHALCSSDGARVVTVDSEGTVRVLDVGTGAERDIFHGHEESSKYAEFSPDGTRVVITCPDGTARVFDALTGAEQAHLREQEAVLLAKFSPDGTRVVTAGWDEIARIFDARTGAELVLLQGQVSPVEHVEFSPDGTRVVTACGDGTASIFDAGTGEELALLRGHETSVFCADFSPDGARVVTASADGTARIFDAGTGAELACLRGHQDLVRHAEFSPDGRRIVTAGFDGTARIWAGSLDELVEQARSRLPVNLTAEEYQDLLKR